MLSIYFFFGKKIDVKDTSKFEHCIHNQNGYSEHFKVKGNPGLRIFAGDDGKLFVTVHYCPDVTILDKFVEDNYDYCQIQFSLPNGMERTAGRYKYKSASGRYGKGCQFYLGAANYMDAVKLHDLIYNGLLKPEQIYPDENLSRVEAIKAYIKNLGPISFFTKFFELIRIMRTI